AGAAEALLTVEDGTGTTEGDRHRQHEPEWAQHDKKHGRNDQVEGPLQQQPKTLDLAAPNTDQGDAVHHIGGDARGDDLEDVWQHAEVDMQVVADLDQVEHLVVAGARQREEDLVDLLLLDLCRQFGDAAHHLTAGEGCARFQQVVEDATDGVAVFGEHRHSVEQELAPCAGADDQYPIGADAVAPLDRENPAQDQAVDRDQDQRDDHRVQEEQP